MTEWTGVRDKRVLITGATRGIGLAAAQALARRGAQLAIVARDDARGVEAATSIKGEGGSTVDVLLADLSSQASVRNLASEVLDRYPRIDVLINNAGATFTSRQLTEDGIERTWALNHLAPFLLTTLLLDRLKASAPARIITTASDAHKGKLIPFDDLNAERSWKGRGFTRYGETKLANIMFTRELARRLEGTGVTTYSFHPGLVATGFNRNNGALMTIAMTIIAPFSRSPRKAAQTLVWLADSPDVTKQTGGYYEDRALAVSSRQAQDPALAKKLWEISEEQVRPKAPAGMGVP
ncbi:MAG: SDR family NAD(P)-dependent oxidoreductase [Candidatus Dormiibacterota bacterium]